MWPDSGGGWKRGSDPEIYFKKGSPVYNVLIFIIVLHYSTKFVNQEVKWGFDLSIYLNFLILFVPNISADMVLYSSRDPHLLIYSFLNF